MQLSKYQEEILNYFSENKQKNIGVSAFAGTGKTFIIERMTEISDTRDIYLAFNNTIAEEFKTKIKNPKTSVMTVHALAYSIMNYNLQQRLFLPLQQKQFASNHQQVQHLPPRTLPFSILINQYFQ